MIKPILQKPKKKKKSQVKLHHTSTWGETLEAAGTHQLKPIYGIVILLL